VSAEKDRRKDESVDTFSSLHDTMKSAMRNVQIIIRNLGLKEEIKYSLYERRIIQN
jgi:hypothetical protein